MGLDVEIEIKTDVEIETDVALELVRRYEVGDRCRHRNRDKCSVGASM